MIDVINVLHLLLDHEQRVLVLVGPQLWEGQEGWTRLKS